QSNHTRNAHFGRNFLGAITLFVGLVVAVGPVYAVTLNHRPTIRWVKTGCGTEGYGPDQRITGSDPFQTEIFTISDPDTTDTGTLHVTKSFSAITPSWDQTPPKVTVSQNGATVTVTIDRQQSGDGSGTVTLKVTDSGSPQNFASTSFTLQHDAQS